MNIKSIFLRSSIIGAASVTSAVSSKTFSQPPNGAGWYAPTIGSHAFASGLSLGSYGPYSSSNFPNFLGGSIPVVGGACFGSPSFVCAAYFSANGANTTDPNNAPHPYYVSGSYNGGQVIVKGIKLY